MPADGFGSLIRVTGSLIPGELRAWRIAGSASRRCTRTCSVVRFAQGLSLFVHWRIRTFTPAIVWKEPAPGMAFLASDRRQLLDDLHLPFEDRQHEQAGGDRDQDMRRSPCSFVGRFTLPFDHSAENQCGRKAQYNRCLRRLADRFFATVFLFVSALSTVHFTRQSWYLSASARKCQR